MAEFGELAEIGEAEERMGAAEFERAIEEQVTKSVEASVEASIGKVLEGVPETIRGEIRTSLEEFKPDLNNIMADQIHIEANAEIPDMKEVGKFDKQLSKTLADSAEGVTGEELSQKIINDALGDPPKAENLTKENLAKSAEKVIAEHMDNLKASMADGLAEDAGRAFDEANPELNPNAPEVKSAKAGLQDTMKDLASDEVTRGKLPEVVDEVGEGGIKESDSAQTKEIKTLRDKIKNFWEETNFKKGFGNLLKLAGVVAAIMVIFPGGRGMLNQVGDKVGDAIGNAINVLANFVEHAFAQFFQGIKDFLKKYMWVFVAIGVVLLVIWLFPLLFGGRGGGGGGTQKVEIEVKQV